MYQQKLIHTLGGRKVRPDRSTHFLAYHCFILQLNDYVKVDAKPAIPASRPYRELEREHFSVVVPSFPCLSLLHPIITWAHKSGAHSL